MDPTALDLRIIHWFAPLQARPLWVDAVNILSQNAIVNGFVFIVPLFLLWHSSESSRRSAAQRLIFVIALGTVIGALGSLLLRQFFAWPPPSVNPISRHFYNPIFRDNPNRNSFPSDSVMLYATVALGVALRRLRLGLGLLAWLVIFVAPSRIFVGGHYATDIIAGMLLGFFSLWFSHFLVQKTPALEKLAVARSLLVQVVLFLWVFEIGNEYRDFAAFVRGLMHIRRHL